MLAMTEEEESPRLYSRGYIFRAPTDEIAPEHLKVHELLVRWGLWVRRRSESSSLASIEGLYTKAGTPAATAPLSADPKLAAIELAVAGIMLLQHRRLLIMLYVFRQSGYTICRAIKLRFEAYPQETHRARELVIQRAESLLPAGSL
jgi:hypothetical protein